MKFHRAECDSLKTHVSETIRRWNLPVLTLTLFMGCLTVLRLKVMQQEVTFIPGFQRCRNIRSTIKSCTPVTNIFFLKTHKCASSTVQNILMRYGDSRNLSFLIPPSTNYIGHPEHFSLSMLSAELTPSYGYNIFCHHTRFQAENVRSVMSVDSVFVTILRHPVDLFESLYGYYDLEKHTGLSLEDFVDSDITMSWLNNHRFNEKIGSNQMLFDLGYDQKNWFNMQHLQQAIMAIHKQFDFVMIAELFEESLVLLRERLCWSNLDMVYFSHNRRHHSAKRRLDSNRKNRLLRYNAGDKMLYDFFYNKMRRRIDEFGRDRMERETRKLRRQNERWYRKCVDSVTVEDSAIVRDSNLRAYGKGVYSFHLRPGDFETSKMCYKLAMAEIPYTEELREKQRTLASTPPICPREIFSDYDSAS